MPTELEPVKAVKAYRNQEFLNSSAGRHIRLLCEYEETHRRLSAQRVSATVMFFGSARSHFPAKHAKALVDARAKLAAAPTGSEEATFAEATIHGLEKSAWMCPLMDNVCDLARRITQWSIDYAASDSAGGEKKLSLVSGVARGKTLKQGGEVHKQRVDTNGEQGGAFHKVQGQAVMVCTGGGPGFMEAANRGAHEAGGRSIGMGITLPFEAGLNPYVTPELAFEYHYFVRQTGL